MTRRKRPTQIPVVEAVPVQLVLGLPIGIRTKRPRKRLTLWEPPAPAIALEKAA